MKQFEFGVYSLGERIPDANGNSRTAQSRIEEIIQMAKMADEAGLDIFGVGEHHRLDFVTSSYAMLLAAIARETNNIKLTSTLSVISTADPVRVYEDFATLDLLSNGRTEIILGRGAFLESFSLFGASLNDYNELFEEKLNLFLKLQEQEVVSWQGNFRSPFVVHKSHLDRFRRNRRFGLVWGYACQCRSCRKTWIKYGPWLVRRSSRIR